MHRYFFKLGRVCWKTPEEEAAENAKAAAAGAGGQGGTGGATPAAALVDGRTQKAIEDDVAKLTAKVGKLSKLIEPDELAADDDGDEDEGDEEEGDLVDLFDAGIAVLSGGLADEDDEPEEEAKPKKKGKAA